MHAAESLLQFFFYGFDRDFFYFRIDGVQSLERIFQQDDRLSLHLIHDREFRLEMQTGVGEGGELQVKGPYGRRPSGGVSRDGIGRIDRSQR